MNNLEQQLAEARARIAELESTLAACEAAGFIDQGGKVRRVLGTLPAFADGTLFGGLSDDDYDTVRVYAVHPANGDVFECYPTPYWSSLDDWRVDCAGEDRCVPLSWCYSTRESAEAARTAREDTARRDAGEGGERDAD